MFMFVDNHAPQNPHDWNRPDPDDSSEPKKMDAGIKRVMWYYIAFAAMFVVVASMVVYFGLGLERERRSRMLAPPTAQDMQLLLQVELDDQATFAGVISDEDRHQYVFRLSVQGANRLSEQLQQVGWTRLDNGVLAKRRGGSLIMLHNLKLRPSKETDRVDALLVWRQTLPNDPLSEIPDRFLEEHIQQAWLGTTLR
jgi:hypothetical protein